MPLFRELKISDDGEAEKTRDNKRRWGMRKQEDKEGDDKVKNDDTKK